MLQRVGEARFPICRLNFNFTSSHRCLQAERTRLPGERRAPSAFQRDYQNPCPSDQLQHLHLPRHLTRLFFLPGVLGVSASRLPDRISIDCLSFASSSSALLLHHKAHIHHGERRESAASGSTSSGVYGHLCQHARYQQGYYGYRAPSPFSRRLRGDSHCGWELDPRDPTSTQDECAAWHRCCCSLY